MKHRELFIAYAAGTEDAALAPKHRKTPQHTDAYPHDDGCNRNIPRYRQLPLHWRLNAGVAQGGARSSRHAADEQLQRLIHQRPVALRARTRPEREELVNAYMHRLELERQAAEEKRRRRREARQAGT